MFEQIRNRKAGKGLPPGIALVFMAGLFAWFLLTPEQDAPAVGPLAKQLSSQVESLASAAGGQALLSTCSARGNLSWGVSCQVRGVWLDKLVAVLKADGWRQVVSKESYQVFERNDRRLWIDVAESGHVASLGLNPVR